MDNVVASAVVPKIHSPSVPDSTCHCNRERKASKLTSPPSFMGVTSATYEPFPSAIWFSNKREIIAPHKLGTWI